MELLEQSIAGVFIVRQQRHADDRGYFARIYCANEFGSRGLHREFVQWSVSFNAKAGTLRGLHWASHEVKLVSCIAGAIWDVVVDVRPGSPTRGKWLGFELTALGPDALYLPEGVAHGFITLAEQSVVQYGISTFYKAEDARGIRYDDPSLAIRWPRAAAVVSAKDLELGAFR